MSTPQKSNGANGLSESRVLPQFITSPTRNSMYMDNVSTSTSGQFERRGNRRSMVIGGGSSRISETVTVLKRRSTNELGAAISARVFNASYGSLRDWIRSERLSRLPPEGSSWDKVLAWAQLFADRLHSFDLAIENFAADSFKAAQIAYGYTSLLLELGHENASALQASFGFFYNCALSLNALLDRSELFAVSTEIREQLALSYADLVTLVADVATHYHRAIRGLTTHSVSVDIYRTFAGPIESFRSRREHIAEAMWKYQMLQENIVVEETVDIATLKAWLAPADRILSGVAGDHAALANDREELTCLWLQPYLLRFIKDQKKFLAITGKPGSGKTVLASTIVDRLHRSIGKKSYSTLYVPINGRVPAQCTPISVVKSLLYQLFEQRIGNISLYRTMAELYYHARQIPDSAAYETHLWNSLADGLSKTLSGGKDVVIVVDGLDELIGDAPAVYKRLQEVVNKQTNVKLVTLAQASAIPASETSRLEITNDLIYDDILAVVKHTLVHNHHYNEKPQAEQEVLASRITAAANGSFLWAKLVSKVLVHEHSHEGFAKAVESLPKAPQSITEQVLTQLQISNLSDEGKLILSWLTTTERPMTTHEIGALLNIDVAKGTVSETPHEVLHILKPINSLVFVQDGLIYLRHSLIRTGLRDLFHAGKYQLPVKDIQVGLVQRLLVYLKFVIRDTLEPSFSSPEKGKVHHLFNQHPLLEYAVRYWVPHFSLTSLYKAQGPLALPKEFTNIFPQSTTLALLEKSCWDDKPTPTTLSWHDLVTRIRRQVLTDKNPATLQSIISCALYYQLVNKTIEASTYFYLAATISRTILPSQHVLISESASYYLEITKSQTTTTRTEIMTRREEILLILIDSYKAQFGATSEIVITTQTLLLELYQALKEETKIKEWKKTIYGEAEVEEEEKGGTREIGGDNDQSLRIRLHRGDSASEIETYTWSLFEHTDRDEHIKTLDFDALLRLAQSYYAEKKIALAEQTYIELWQRISEHARHHASVEIESKKIDIMLAYSNFLKSEKRESEASSILTAIWQEYEHSTVIRSEQISVKLVEVAKTMKTVGLVTASLAIFKYAASYFQSTNKKSSSFYQEIEQQIHSTSQELVKKVSSSKESHQVVSESMLIEIISGSSSSTSTTKTYDETSISAVKMLSITYISQHRWKDATHVIKQFLHAVWPSFFAPSIEDVVLPTKHLDECLELAERLAGAYAAQRRLEKVENVRIRLYRAAKASRKHDDKLVETYRNELLRFYERNELTSKVIALYQDILADHRAIHGDSHAHVVKVLFTLAELTRPGPISIDYYTQIVRILTKGGDVTSPEAFEPLIIVGTHYWDERRYPDAAHIYKLLFTAFTKKPKEYKHFHDQKFVRTVFERYVTSLRETRVDISIIYQVTKEYRSVVISTFGATSAIAVQATLTLARTCQSSKRYEAEAISLYEELLKIESSEVNHHEIKSVLSAIYEEQALIATRSATSQTTTSEQVNQAVTILRQRITSTRSTYGWSSEESLTQLREMSTLYAKQSKSEVAVTELNEATKQIISTEKSSTKLISSAVAIAESYFAAGQTTKGIEIAEEMHRQIVAKDTRNVKKYNFDYSSSSRSAAIFLAQLEYSLRRDGVTTFSEIYAAIITEMVYFENYRKVISSSSNIVEVFESAVKLRAFLASKKRTDMVNHIDDEVTHFFLKHEGQKVKITDHASAKLLVITILDHIAHYKITNFTRSVSIAGNERVRNLIGHGHYKDACELALSTFRYVLAHGGYKTLQGLRHGFVLSLIVSGRHQTKRTHDAGLRKSMLDISATILEEILSISKTQKINLAQVQINDLNALVGLLGEQRSYKTLEWLLTLLWTTREAQRAWRPSVSLALGRRLILVRYLTGHVQSALRLAEDIAYNLRRVHGARHAATLDMHVLLSQLYTSIGENFQGTQGGTELAKAYYKRAAGVHENVLRFFSDDVTMTEDDDELELHGSMHLGSADESLLELSRVEGKDAAPGEQVRKHLFLLKLALERFGGWPKAYAEYERLNADVYRLYPTELKGFEGVEKWNVKSFGNGKAEAKEGLLDSNLQTWEFLEPKSVVEAEEEL